MQLSRTAAAAGGLQLLQKPLASFAAMTAAAAASLGRH
jgi:hypothetical protein